MNIKGKKKKLAFLTLVAAENLCFRVGVLKFNSIQCPNLSISIKGGAMQHTDTQKHLFVQPKFSVPSRACATEV